ncbi:MAG: hypothetical protein LBE21_02185, partial [Pseudomonadales bacterium]|nr:hypothetical protein [Pseudomonadales bacterium]
MKFWTFPRQRTASVLLLALCHSLSGIVLAQTAGASPQLTLPLGLSEAVAQNIAAHLQLARQSCDEPLANVRRRLPEISAQVDQALQALGYYNATHILQVNPINEGNCWELQVVSLNPGLPVTVSQVNIQVQGDAEAQALFAPAVASANLISGQALDQGRYEELKNALISLAMDEGYFDARFERNEIAVDLVDNNSVIELIFNPGSRYHFGLISVEGEAPLDSKMIMRMIETREGDPYSSTELAALRGRLDASQYFRSIQVAPRLGQSADQSVPIDVMLQLQPRHAWTGGLGFSTDTGPNARLSYENRYVNSAGHTLRA